MGSSKLSNSITSIESNMSPKVAVIILNYNGKKYLGRLLDEAIESALNQTYPNIEVIFADNGSVDRSVEYVNSKYGSKVKVVALGTNYGFCLGNNLALKHVSSNTKYLLFLNPDAVLSNKYVEKLVFLMEGDESVGVAHGLEVLQDGSRRCIGGLVSIYGQSHLVELEEPHIKSGISKIVRVLWAIGSAMMVRKELFDKVGGFSPELFMYYDELDLCCRILYLGFKTVGLPSAIYTHKLGGIAHTDASFFSRKRARLLYLFNRNRWLIVIRYFPKKLLFQSSVAFLAEFLNNIYKSLWCKEKNLRREHCTLYLKILLFLTKNLRRELFIRNSYKGVQKQIIDYVIPKSLPLKLRQTDIARFMTKQGLW